MLFRSGSRRGGSRGSADHAQLPLALDLAPDPTVPSGLPELTAAERVRAEPEVLGMDVSHHLMDFYADLLGRDIDGLLVSKPSLAVDVVTGSSS